MAQKKNNNKKRYIMLSIMLVIGIVGAICSIIGASKLLNRGIAYDEAIIACDDKNYSSYVKTTEVETPGNEYINQQIETYRRAIENAKNDGNATAVGMLMEEYNNLLQTQAQTKTTHTEYDYSEVEKAKSKCYSLARKQRDSSFTSGLIWAIVGGVLLLVGVVGSIYTGFKIK